MCEELDSSVEVAAATVARAIDGQRRGFFRTLAGLVVAALMLPASLVRAKKVAVSVAKIDALQKVGGSAMLKIKEQKILFVRDSDTSVRAINPICSHKHCTVKFTADDGKLHCPCHKSAYDLDGKVLGGPAPRPLETFPAELQGEQVILTLPDEP